MDRRVKVRAWLSSLESQLLLWAILPLILLVIGWSFTGVHAHRRTMASFAARRNVAMVELVAANVAGGVENGALAADGSDLPEALASQIAELPGTLAVLDAAGRPLLQNAPFPEGRRPADLAPGVAPGTADVVMDAGTALLVTTAEVPGTAWTVVHAEAVDELLGPILRLSGAIPAVALLAAGVMLLLFALGWRTIVHPLRELARAAGQVTWGDHTAIDGVAEEGVTEIRELRRAMTAMVERLEGYESGIRDYLDAVTRGQESERARLARELHDGPVQELIALGQRVEMARRLVNRGETEPAADLLDELQATEIATVEELRRIIGALRPVYLEDLGFLPALQMLVRAADERSPAQVRLEHGPGLRRLHPEVELAAYRITQEALNNALQHANAERITVRVHCTPEGVTLAIEDDGQGFERAERPDALTRRGHFGLVGLWERVRQMGGSLQIDTAPGAGTRLSVQLPDRPQEDAGNHT